MSRNSANRKAGDSGKLPSTARMPFASRSMWAGQQTPPVSVHSRAASSRDSAVALGSKSGSLSVTQSSPSITSCSPNMSGRLRKRMRCASTARSNTRASSNRSKRQTMWISSAVVSSMPATAIKPKRSAACIKPGQLRQVLWSVSATMRNPARLAMPAMLPGVISLSAQGDRQE